MKTLTEYTKNGFDFKLLRREGRIALFVGTKEGQAQINYEVIRIQFNRAGERFGKTFPDSESGPRNEMWGDHGWTFVTLEQAEARFQSLCSPT